MIISLRHKGILVTAVAVVILHSPCLAVVLHDGVGASQTPGDAYVGSWGGYASCVPVAGSFVVLSAHQGGGFGTAVSIAGQDYVVAKKIQHSSADLSVALLYNPTGAPAQLSHWAKVHTSADGADYYRDMVIGGYGQTTGSTLYTDSGVPYGYKWAGDTRTLRWGSNYIDRVLFTISGSAYMSKGLQADFDYPGEGGAVVGEAIGACGDSGGGWFLPDGQGGWTVAGLSVQVQNGGESLFRDPVTGAPAPDAMYAVRLSQYASWIDQVIAENQPIFGDVNLDLTVDIHDIAAVKNSYGTYYGTDGYSFLADLDGDGYVGAADLSAVKSAFLNAMEGSATATVVPEPATMSLLAFGALAAAVRRRRR
ncbi:MAG: dockerin type I domain-containing protein [Phycisphaerae bacterium]